MNTTIVEMCREQSHGVTQITDKMLEVLDAFEKSDPVASGETGDELPEFIHLSDVHFFTPGQQPIPTNGKPVCWRGRIADVSGFHFGIIKSAPI
jgi:hypothetical protein